MSADTNQDVSAVGQSMASILDVQAAQAAHARAQEIQRLSRLHPVVRELVEELDALKAKLADAGESKRKK